MRSAYLSCLGIFILAIVVTAHSSAASEGDERAASAARSSDSSEKVAKAQAPAPSIPVYVPPRRGKPRARIGGGVRGVAANLPTLRALVPDHVAHTARSQPTLLWDLGGLPPETAELVFRFRLTSQEKIDPLIEVVLEPPSRPGLQRIELAEFEFSLETGHEYQWSVTLVSGSDRPARDPLTLGWIERVEGPEALAIHAEVSAPSGTSARADVSALADAAAPLPSVAAASPSAAAALPDAAALAAAGLWYDAVDVASGVERAALLEQIGLLPAGPP